MNQKNPIREGSSAADPTRRKTDTTRRVDSASQVGEDIKHEAYQLAEDARQTVMKATERAKDSGQQYLTGKKKVLADEVGIFSSAIRKASGKLREEDHNALADYVDAAAEQLDYLRSSFQNKSVTQLLEDAQQVVRRRPEVVYGGMFVAGLLAMRFLKAAPPANAHLANEQWNAPRNEQRENRWGQGQGQGQGQGGQGQGQGQGTSVGPAVVGASSGRSSSPSPTRPFSPTGTPPPFSPPASTPATAALPTTPKTDDPLKSTSGAYPTSTRKPGTSS
jgi:hypothetical protein